MECGSLLPLLVREQFAESKRAVTNLRHPPGVQRFHATHPVEPVGHRSRSPVLQSVRVAPFREDFYHGWQDDTDGANAEYKMQNEDFLSVKSVKSVVKFLWLRLCHAASICPNLRAVLDQPAARLFCAFVARPSCGEGERPILDEFHRKLFSMNILRAKRRLLPIKPNQT